MIRLRGHHLLCIQGFQGYGYSEEFLENMKKIHKKIISNEENIQLVTGPDDICKSCPNLNNDKCKNNKENNKCLFEFHISTPFLLHQIDFSIY